MRAILFVALTILTCSTTARAQPGPNHDVEGWVSDLRQVRDAMGSHYANLDWAVREREAPLAQLFQVGEQRLRLSQSEAEAREVFERLEQFIGDGHLDFVWPLRDTAAPATASATGDLPPCDQLGYRAGGRDGSAVASRLPGYRPLDGDSGFPAGLVEVEGVTLGVVRIAQMSAQAHPEACAAALAALSRPADTPCENECLDALRVQAVDHVTADLTARLRALHQAGAQGLLVDLAGNGGGSEWVEVAVRLFSDVRLRSARMGFPRHPHWVERFARDEARFAALAEDRPAEERAQLQSYRAAFAQARHQAETPCDPTPWLVGGAPIDCAWLTTAPLYATGPVNNLDPDLINKPWAAEAFTPLAYRFEPGVWTGPLLVLVDGATGSAAEQFAAILQDNEAALIVGAPTAGAGCGHARGEIVTVLNHSGARLRLPNCARLRADGTNEVGGVEPDVLVGFRRNDGPSLRVARLLARLPQALAAAGLGDDD